MTDIRNDILISEMDIKYVKSLIKSYKENIKLNSINFGVFGGHIYFNKIFGTISIISNFIQEANEEYYKLQQNEELLSLKNSRKDKIIALQEFKKKVSSCKKEKQKNKLNNKICKLVEDIDMLSYLIDLETDKQQKKERSLKEKLANLKADLVKEAEKVMLFIGKNSGDNSEQEVNKVFEKVFEKVLYDIKNFEDYKSKLINEQNLSNNQQFSLPLSCNNIKHNEDSNFEEIDNLEDKKQESIHEYLIQNIYTKFCKYDEFLNKFKNNMVVFEDLKIEFNIMHFDEEKCLKLFKNLKNPSELNKEKDELKNKLENDAEFKKIFENESVITNILNSINNTRNTKIDYLDMFSKNISKYDKDIIDGLFLLIFLQFREISFIEEYGARNIFFDVVLFDFLEKFKGNYALKLAYLKEILKHYKEFDPKNKELVEAYKTIINENKSIVFLPGHKDNKKNGENISKVRFKNTHLYELFDKFTKIYLSKDVYYRLTSENTINFKDEYINYIQRLDRNYVLEFFQIFKKIDKENKTNFEEDKYKKYMKERFLFNLNYNLPLSEYTLIEYNYKSIIPTIIVKSGPNIIEIDEIINRVIKFICYDNLSFSEMDLRVLMYVIYGDPSAIKKIQERLILSQNKSKNINKNSKSIKITPYILFEKVNQIFDKYLMNRKKYVKENLVINSIYSRIDKTKLYLKILAEKDKKITKIHFNLDEILFMNFLMQKYFYKWNDLFNEWHNSFRVWNNISKQYEFDQSIYNAYKHKYLDSWNEFYKNEYKNMLIIFVAYFKTFDKFKEYRENIKLNMERYPLISIDNPIKGLLKYVSKNIDKSIVDDFLSTYNCKYILNDI